MTNWTGEFDERGYTAWLDQRAPWLDITSAPRDGTRILVWRPDEGDGVHRAHPGFDIWRENSHGKGLWWFSRRNQQPTHWLSSPIGPQAKGAQNEQ